MTRLNNDLISRKALLEELNAAWEDNVLSTLRDAVNIITNAPTIEADSAEAVTKLWESIGRWSAYLVSNGVEANLSPPDWLVDAVKNATSPQKREWVDLTDEQIDDLCRKILTPFVANKIQTGWLASNDQMSALVKNLAKEIKEVNHG